MPTHFKLGCAKNHRGLGALVSDEDEGATWVAGSGSVWSGKGNAVKRTPAET